MTRRLCGHVSGGPREVFDQSYAPGQGANLAALRQEVVDRLPIHTRNPTQCAGRKPIAGAAQSTMAALCEFREGFQAGLGAGRPRSLNQNFMLDIFGNQN